MNSGDNDPRPFADILRSRGASPDTLSLFDSEGPDLATPPSANRDLLHKSEDPVREVRQRLAGKPQGTSLRAIPGRLGAMKIRMSETAADIQSRVTSRIRNYIVQHPKLLVPMASITCVLIIAFVAGFAVHEVEIVPAPMQSASAEIARNRADVVQPSDRAAASVTSTVTNESPAGVNTVDAQRRASDPTQVKPRAAKSAVTVQRSAVDVRSTPTRRTPAAESSAPVPARASAAIPSAQNVAGAATVLSSNTNPPAVLTATESRLTFFGSAPGTGRPDSRYSRSTPVLSTSDPYANAIYSQKDPSVRPPQMIDIDLPRPAVANWTTVRNSMEVIIAENGSVERVKWLGSPRRLPDVMLLSRAKLWKFAPAVKDGQAVRYKLVINWDVNP